MNESNSDYALSEHTSNEATSKRSARRLLLFMGGVIIFIIGVSLGSLIPNGQPYDTFTYEQAKQLLTGQEPQTVGVDLLWDVWNTVKQRHLNQPVDDQQLLYGSITGLVAGLNDPYSVFFTPDQSQEFMNEINGEFEGIGAEIGIKNETLTIIAPLPGSPAAQAGLQPGDHIMLIDGVDSTFLSLNAAVDAIRGEQGTTVVLRIERSGVQQPFEVTVQRASIHIESVTQETITQNDNTYVHITISQFSNDTAQKFQEIVTQLTLQKPDGIIIDLRNNAGGYLDAAVKVASAYVVHGNAVVIEQRSDGTEQQYAASGVNALNGIPTVVLINEGSASASEILAGALQDYDAAVVIGTTSFGKGTVQDLQTFEDGSALKLTIARWLTPMRRGIDSTGIAPDYTFELTEEDFSNERDPQFDAALQYLTDSATFVSTHELFQTNNTQQQE